MVMRCDWLNIIITARPIAMLDAYGYRTNRPSKEFSLSPKLNCKSSLVELIRENFRNTLELHFGELSRHSTLAGVAVSGTWSCALATFRSSASKYCWQSLALAYLWNSIIKKVTCKLDIETLIIRTPLLFKQFASDIHQFIYSWVLRECKCFLQCLKKVLNCISNQDGENCQEGSRRGWSHLHIVNWLEVFCKKAIKMHLWWTNGRSNGLLLT